MGKWSFTIDQPVPSLNVMEKVHWAEVKRLKNLWIYLIRSALPSDITPATGRRRVTIHRFSPGELDLDNLAGGSKHIILDLLRKPGFKQGTYRSGPRKGQPWTRVWMGLGLIVDDNRKWCDPVYRQTVIPRGKPGRTEITVEDLDA